jgi:hypothetical protein
MASMLSSIFGLLAAKGSNVIPFIDMLRAFCRENTC